MLINSTYIPIKYSNNNYNNKPAVTHPVALAECPPKEPDISFKSVNYRYKDAIKEGNISRIKFLDFFNAVNVNDVDDYGTTALCQACYDNQEELVKYFLENKTIDINRANRDGYTALIRASKDGRDKLVKLLLENQDIDPNVQDNRGETALFKAGLGRNSYILELLLKHPKTDVNIKNRYSRTLLHELCNEKFDYPLILSYLLAHPYTDVNIKDSQGRTPLIFAASKGMELKVKRLLEHPNIDVNVRMAYDVTAFYEACNQEHADVVKLFLERPDVDINSPTTGSRTPFMVACYYNRKDVVELLLQDPRIDLTVADNNRMSTLDYAKRYLYDSKLIAEVEEAVKFQLDHPELIGRYKKPVVNMAQLSPEENIWTEKEITDAFMKLLDDSKYQEAIEMFEKTPLIDLDADEQKVLVKICYCGNPDLAEKAFEYRKNRPAMLEGYERKRNEFFEKTLGTLSYEELKNNNFVLNTPEAFEVLLRHPEFNPNDTVDGSTLFETACVLDIEGNYAKEILNKYDDVNTGAYIKSRNSAIRTLVEEYETTGKIRLKLRHIMENAMNEETRSVAAEKLMEFMQSDEFNPEIRDEFGNSILHIAAALPDDSGRTLIQKALDKGVNKDGGNIAGQTPLMSAIKSLITTRDEAGKRNVMANIKFLLDKGVNINAQDNNGQTAFHFACLGTVAALLTLMLSKNPNVFLLDKHGNRASKYLKTEKMKEIYKNYVLL